MEVLTTQLAINPWTTGRCSVEMGRGFCGTTSNLDPCSLCASPGSNTPVPLRLLFHRPAASSWNNAGTVLDALPASLGGPGRMVPADSLPMASKEPYLRFYLLAHTQRFHLDALPLLLTKDLGDKTTLQIPLE